MRKKMLWGIGTLILLLLGVTAVLLLRDTDIEPEVIYKTDVEPARKTETPVAEKPTARPGFEMVKHDDHWHEVPIDEPEIMQDEPTTQSKSVKPYTGPLTYHKELLDTHPVEALRKQAEERGHWSAKWIPPFPPDDTEAAEIARTKYLIIYYETIGDTDNPKYKKANRADSEQISRAMERTREVYSAYTQEAIESVSDLSELTKPMGRVSDLGMLSWPRFPEADVPQYPLYEKGWRKSYSNYFPMRIEDLKFPLQISDSK